MTNLDVQNAINYTGVRLF